MFKRPRQEPLNLLELIPERRQEHQTDSDGKVVILIPRFRNAWLQKHLLPKSRSPHLRISLDDFGSLTWSLCDGQRNVRAIAAALSAQFGEKVDPVHERTSYFILQLQKQGFIRLRRPDGQPA